MRPLKLPLILLALLLAPFSTGETGTDTEVVDIIVRGDYLLTMDPAQSPIADGAVAVRDGIILASGDWSEIQSRYRAPVVLAGEGRVVMPGLVNGHTHTPMTLFRGMADDLDLMDWLNNYIFPIEKRFVDAELVRIGAELACWEMIRGGTTSFVDMYFYPEVIASVVQRCGLRAIVAAPHIDFSSPGFKGWDDSFAAAVEFIKAWKGRHPRITPAFAPHSAYTVTPDHIEATAQMAAKLAVPVSMHIAESPAETEHVRTNYKTTPVQHVNKTGLFEQQLIGAHMVHLNKDDIGLVADKGVGAVHNPTSNMKLGVGVAPVIDMIAAGVNVGLGTDGAASNNDLDMWEEIRLVALVQKLESGDPKAIPAAVALDMATRMGAAAIGLGGKVGQLVAGKQADIIQVDFSQTIHIPLYDIESHLVYVLDSQNVVTTIVNGRILMQDGKVMSLDEAKIRRDVARKRDEIQIELSAGHGS